MHVEFVVLKHIILETVLIHASVVVTHAYVFLRELLDIKMNALAIGIGKHKMVNLNALRLNKSHSNGYSVQIERPSKNLHFSPITHFYLAREVNL